MRFCRRPSEIHGRKAQRGAGAGGQNPAGAVPSRCSATQQSESRKDGPPLHSKLGLPDIAQECKEEWQQHEYKNSASGGVPSDSIRERTLLVVILTTSTSLLSRNAFHPLFYLVTTHVGSSSLQPGFPLVLESAGG